LKKLIIIIIVFALAVGCKAKQPTVITNTIRDTINISTIRTVQVPIETEIIIKDPCDSLGILKDFKQTFKTKKVYITVQSKNGDISAEINLDSIEEVFKTKYEGKTEIVVKEIPVDKPVPFIPKVFWIMVGYSVLMTMWKFKRFIPFLKFLPF